MDAFCNFYRFMYIGGHIPDVRIEHREAIKLTDALVCILPNPECIWDGWLSTFLGFRPRATLNNESDGTCISNSLPVALEDHRGVI